MPITPRSKSWSISGRGILACSSIARTCGRISRSANAATESRNSRSSSVSCVSGGTAASTRAAVKLHRTQARVCWAVRRLEQRLSQPLFDRTSNPGVLTEAGHVLKAYGERLIRLADEAETSVHELEDLKRGRVLIGTNDAG